MSHLILFWSNYPQKGEPVEAWSNRPLEMSQLHKLSIASYAKFATATTIYTYQAAPECPFPNVTFANASEIYPIEDAFAALVQGHSLAHVSDVVRLQAALAVDGIVLDMDAVLLREPPNLPYFFASMPAKLTGGFAPKWGKAHPPLAVHDKSWDGKALSAFPVKVSADIAPQIAHLISKIKHTLKLLPMQSSKAWNYIMWDLKRIAWEKRDAVVHKPIAFCPIPAWMGSGKCYSLQVPTRFNGSHELFGYVFPSIDTIMREGHAVQHFFESSYKASAKMGSDFWLTVSDDCLLGREAKHVLGDSWRKSLTER
jgi:hypothetical protein